MAESTLLKQVRGAGVVTKAKAFNPTTTNLPAALQR
jgi:hypothetical protein